MYYFAMYTKRTIFTIYVIINSTVLQNISGIKISKWAFIRDLKHFIFECIYYCTLCWLLAKNHGNWFIQF